MTTPTCRQGAAGLLLMLLAPPLASAIYRCSTADDVPRYSQFPCGEHAEMVMDAPQIIDVPPLSDAEQAVLDDLARDRAARTAQRQQARREAARRTRRERAERQDRCREVESAIDDLKRRRRKGYSLHEARDLDRREAELEAEEHSTCR